VLTAGTEQRGPLGESLVENVMVGGPARLALAPEATGAAADGSVMNHSGNEDVLMAAATQALGEGEEVLAAGVFSWSDLVLGQTVATCAAIPCPAW
jgi:hypothetical protein